MPTRADPAIQELLDRAEIRDLMTRYSRAVDRCDLDLLRSLFTEDIYFNYDNGRTQFIGHAGYEQMILGLKRHRVTMHFMENQLIDITGDAARIETYANNHHIDVGPDGKETDRVVLCRYQDQVVRIDGRWKIKHRVMIVDFTRLDPIVPTK